MQNIIWLFPIIFMIHEMEEIIGIGMWLRKNTDIIEKYNKLSDLNKGFSNEGFSVAILEEYLLCIIITSISIYFNTYIVWIGTFIAFSFHLAIHIIQSIIIRRYIPALLTSIVLLPISILLINKSVYICEYSCFSIIISAILCIIAMVINLIFLHKLMKKITIKIRE